MNRLEVSAPAKLNLGLEVVGRRADGFHDIVTIFQTISLVDHLVFSTLGDGATSVLHVDRPGLSGADNLVLRAADAFRAATAIRSSIEIELRKRIPAAAGLGGASSDAAATLLALERLWERPLTSRERQAIAVQLGSDVPFFLSGGTALATGRGDLIEPLPPLTAGCFVIVVPTANPPIDRKTASLYAALRPEDFSPGTAVRKQAARLRRGEPPSARLLGNAFQRALYELRPEVAVAGEHLLASGAPFAALSGAGTAHYTLLPKVEEAEVVATRLRTTWKETMVFIAHPTPTSKRFGLHSTDG